MTATKKFIEDAVRGGWYPKNYKPERFVSQAIRAVQKSKFVERWLLDPLAWQAVGKTRGWHLPIAVEVHFRDHEDYRSDVDFDRSYPEWLWRQHRFIDHLADGKTIEEALQAIE